jgi:hypothetical protein
VDADETEFMENVFDALCSALNESQCKTLFLASEGVDLMVLMMKYILDALSPPAGFLMHRLGRMYKLGQGLSNP